MLHSRFFTFGNVNNVVFPENPDKDSLNDYLQAAIAHEKVFKSTELQDFLGINWSGFDLKFMESLTEFMKIVIPQLYTELLNLLQNPQFSHAKKILLQHLKPHLRFTLICRHSEQEET